MTNFSESPFPQFDAHSLVDPPYETEAYRANLAVEIGRHASLPSQGRWVVAHSLLVMYEQSLYHAGAGVFNDPEIGYDSQTNLLTTSIMGEHEFWAPRIAPYYHQAGYAFVQPSSEQVAAALRVGIAERLLDPLGLHEDNAYRGQLDVLHRNIDYALAASADRHKILACITAWLPSKRHA